jgi:spermidine/putrescine transport system substrate-binding protein
MTEQSLEQFGRRDIIKYGSIASLAGMAGCLGGDSGGGSGDGEYVRPVEIEEWPPEDYNSELNSWNWYSGWNEWGAEAFAEEYDLESYNTEAYASPTDWFSRLQANPEDHGIDSIGSFTEWVDRVSNEDMLEPIPIDIMPNVEIPDRYISEMRENYYSDEGVGGVYGLPHSVVISPVVLYNKDNVQDPPETLDLLWDEEYAGEISMFANQPPMLCEVGARYTGIVPNNPDDFDEIQEALEQQRDLVFNYADDHETQMNTVVTGEATFATHTDGRGFRAIYEEGGNVGWFVPKEGSTWGTDAFTIPKNAPNPRTTTMFLNFMFSSEGLNNFVKNSLYRPPVSNEELTDGDLGEMIRENWDKWGKEGNPDDFIDDLVLDDETMSRLDHSWPKSEETIERYDEIWTAVTSG